MSKQIKVNVDLNDKEAKQKLKNLQEGKYKIDLDVNADDAKQATQNLTQMGKSANNTITVFGKLKSAIHNTFSSGKLAMTGYLAVLKSIDTAAKNAQETIKEMDNAVTDLSVAMGKGRSEAYNYLKTLNKQAQELGATTKETADSSDTWLRQGKSIAETEKLVYDSMILSKLGKIESADASTYLTSALNGYRKSASEAIDVVDKLTAVDMESASDAGGLAESMSKTASAADMAGVSMDKLIGMIATVKETTQDSDESVGNMFKSVFSRMNQIKAGKFVDADTGESLNDTEKVLTKIGITMRDANGQFLSSEKIMDEVGAKWSNFDSVTQRAVATAMAGTYQYNKLIALFNNYSKALDYTKVSAESAGTAVEKFNNSYANSLEAKQNTLQSTFESAVLNSDIQSVYGDILDATIALVKFVDEANVLKGVLSGSIAFGAIKLFASIKMGANEAYIELNKFKNAMDIVSKSQISTTQFDRLLQLSDGLSKKQMKLILSTNSLTVAQKKELLVASGLSEEESIATLQAWQMTAANNGLTASTTTASNAFKGLWLTLKANPLILITSAITIGITAWQNYKQSIEEAVQSASEAADSYKNQTSSIEEQISKYQELREQLLKTNGDEEAVQSIKSQLLELQKQLNEEFGTEYGKLNLVTDAYKDQTEAIKVYNKEAAKKYLNENRKGIEIATDKMNENKTYSLGSMNGIVNADEVDLLNQISAIASQNGIEFTNSGFQFVGNAEDANKAINNFMNSLKDLQSESGDVSKTMSGIFDGLLDASGEALTKTNDIISEYQEIYNQSQLAEIASSDTLSSAYNTAIDVVQEYNDAVSNSDNPYNDENVKSAYENLQKIKSTISDDSDWDAYRSIIDDTFSEADTASYEFKQKLDSNKDGINDCANALKGLTETDLQAMADSGDNESFNKLTESAEQFGLSVEDVISLLEKMEIVIADNADNTNLNQAINFDTDSFFEKVDAIQSGYEKLLSAQEEFNNYGAVTSATLKDLMDNDLLQYMTVTADGISINTSALEDNEQALKDSATAELYNAMCNDIQKLSLDDTSKLSEVAQTAIANLDSVATTAGENAAIAAQGWWEYGNSIKNIPGVVNLTGDKEKKAEAIVNSYKNLANQINNISVGKTTSSKKKSASSSKSSSTDATKEAFQAEYDLLKHNLDMEYITEEEYYNGVAALNEKYFKGKEQYLDEYRKYEEEVYKGLKSYYKSYCDDMMDYYEKALDANKLSYKDYCDKVSAMLADMHNSGKISAKDWYDYTQTMLNKQKDIYDRALSAITRRIEKEIDKIQDKIDALNDQNDLLNDQKDQMDSAIDAITKVYDTEIDRIQGIIDSLKDANDERERTLALEKAKYELEKAYSQRVKKIYTEGKGYTYEVDYDAIRDAQKSYDDAELDVKTDELQKQIDTLEEFKQKWQDVQKAYQENIDNMNATALLGSEYQKLILNNNIIDIENFKTKYLNIQSQINDNEQLIKSYEEKVEYYNKLKEQWSSLTDEYSNSVDDMYAKQLLGAQWESDVLSGRVDVLNKFRDDYNRIQQDLVDTAWKSANAQISALNAVKQAEATKAQTSGGSGGNVTTNSGSGSSVSGSTSTTSSKRRCQARLAGTVKVLYETTSEADLQKWITSNGYMSTSRSVQDSIVVYFVKSKPNATKYRVVNGKTGKVMQQGFTSMSAAQNYINSTQPALAKYLKVEQYAKGTNNAEKGLHKVSEHEFGDEIIIKNDGSAVVPHGEQLYDFEGGETVIPAKESKQILENQGNVEELPEGSITLKDGTILTPIHYEPAEKFAEYLRNGGSITPINSNIAKDNYDQLMNNTKNINNVNNSQNVAANVTIGDIHLHEVQNPDQLADAICKYLPGTVDQKLSKRRR